MMGKSRKKLFIRQRKNNLSVFLIMIICGISLLWAGFSEKTPSLYWTFDSIGQEKIKQDATSRLDIINGNYRQVVGIKGKALVFDGYTTSVVHPGEDIPELGSDFTISAWIALGAYPWNWAPIVAQENTVSLNSNLDHYCWPDDIKPTSGRDGFYFGVSPEGYLGLMVGTQQAYDTYTRWVVCRSESRLPLRKWIQVVAVFKKQRGVELYINGKKVAEKIGVFTFSQAKGEPVRIGMNREKREPAYPVSPQSTLACWYSFDGLMDEIKIFNEALPSGEIAGLYSRELPETDPELPVRIMPSGPDGPGKFGAYYTTLSYYPEWDRLWPINKDADVVVQFDNSPVRVVFWRGTRYSPVWVMDKMHWMADQSVENGNALDGCLEHMLDAKCEFSNVRIIENTEARVVVHWRYSPVASNGARSQVDPISGWPDWVDEYYTFYPDQVGVRKVILHTKGRSLTPQEFIVLCHPGQQPEDVIDLKAMTLMNLKGQLHTYDWFSGPPEIYDTQGKYLDFGDRPEERPTVVMVNMKSEYKPIQIFEPGNRIEIYDLYQGYFRLRQGLTHFPWWNHWPVAQIPSDGRYCQAPDRESHFALCSGDPPTHREEGNIFWWAWLYGATNKSVETLLPLARSWVDSPEIRVYSSAYKNYGYDLTQRCYLLSRLEKKAEELEIELAGSEESPVYNPALYIENWGETKFLLKVNGKEISGNVRARTGYLNRLGGTDLIIWLEIMEKVPVRISLTPTK